MRLMNRVHGAVLRGSGGRLGWRLFGMPVVELTTVGRRSGRPRTSLLTSPIRTDDGLVVVASRGGDDRHPAWFLNLRADPEVIVRSGRAPARPMRARVVPDEESDRLWQRIAEHKPHYLRYQERTDRRIPLVVLEETGPRPPT